MVSVLAIHKVQHSPALLVLDLGGTYPIPVPLHIVSTLAGRAGGAGSA